MRNRFLEAVGSKRRHASAGVEVIEKEYHLMGLILELITEHGNLEGLQDYFSSKGFGHLFSNWVGFDENAAITPEQVQQVFGKEHLFDLAQRVGLEPEDAPALLANYLPKVIDYLTPGGEIESHQDLVGFLVALLNGGLDQMLAQQAHPHTDAAE